MWIKICGVREIATARQIIPHAPDAIGLNFYAQSRRFVDVDTARKIVELLPSSITPVGVFVNHSVQEIRSICSACRIGTVQLHGDETPSVAAELAEFRLLRAFRVSEDHFDEFEAELSAFLEARVPLQGCLVDARVGNAYGGTGHQAPWELLSNRWQSDWPPLILAGGLKPENVAEAIQTVRPWGVDVASGVEDKDGRQTPSAVQRFISHARRASR